MNYELVLKLKETGFVPSFKNDFYTKEGLFFRADTNRPFIGNEVFIPTLSELIEACGDKNDFTLYTRNKIWRAVLIDKQEGITILGADGITPEEAVALLWLELNKK